MDFIHRTAGGQILSAQDKGGRWLFSHLYYDLLSTSLMLLVVEVGVWRDVEVVGVGDVVSEFFAWAFVWGDVDPHSGDLGAGESVSARL